MIKIGHTFIVNWNLYKNTKYSHKSVLFPLKSTIVMLCFDFYILMFLVNHVKKIPQKTKYTAYLIRNQW